VPLNRCHKAARRGAIRRASAHLRLADAGFVGRNLRAFGDFNPGENVCQISFLFLSFPTDPGFAPGEERESIFVFVESGFPLTASPCRE
jgi:hypothetical protein